MPGGDHRIPCRTAGNMYGGRATALLLAGCSSVPTDDSEIVTFTDRHGRVLTVAVVVGQERSESEDYEIPGLDCDRPQRAEGRGRWLFSDAEAGCTVSGVGDPCAGRLCSVPRWGSDPPVRPGRAAGPDYCSGDGSEASAWPSSCAPGSGRMVCPPALRGTVCRVSHRRRGRRYPCDVARLRRVAAFRRSRPSVGSRPTWGSRSSLWSGPPWRGRRRRAAGWWRR